MPKHPANRAKAQTPKIDTKGLPVLTGKQMLFVEGVVAGKSASEAYRAAYDAEGMSPTSVSGAAAVLRHSRDVNAWICAWHVAHMASGLLTKEEHIRELGAIRELSKDQGDLKSAVAAEHLRGKVSGFYVERSEVTVYDPAAILAQIANIDRTIAARLAERFNLPLPALLAGPLADQPVDGEDVSLVPGQPLNPADPSE